MNDVFGPEHIKFKKYFGIAVISLFSLLLIFIFWGFFLAPKVKATSPKNNAINGDLKKVEINFNKPVNRSNLSTTISPEVAGKWQYEGQILGSHLFTKLVFYPNQYLTPEQSYLVKIDNISSILHLTPNNDFSFDFKAQPLPKIQSTSIENNQINVAIDQPIIVKLDQPNDFVVDYDFIFTPEVDFSKSYSASDHQYRLDLKTNLGQATKYIINAKRMLNGIEVKDDFSLSFTTLAPPAVSSFYPTGNSVFIDTGELGIIFDQDLISTELITNTTISPSLAGQWKWDQNNKKLIFTPSEKLKYATKYTVSIAKGVHGTSNNFLSEDISLTFSTIGTAQVLSTTPKNNASGVSSNAIGITFNQEVDHASAEKSFYIEPSVSGTFSWNGNALTFNSAGFANDSSYKFGERSAIASVHGLASTQSFDYTFSTKASETILNVALDYQDKPLSCEAASLKMVLNFRGAGITENDIMNIIGYDPTIRNGNVWGDPYSAFVGDINGKQDTTGYGVYWDPIAKAAHAWRTATAFTGWSTSQVLQEIANGNPVVVWGVTGGSIARDDWVTPQGKAILAWHGEHARTLIGFRGTISNPSAIILNDPVSGRITWTKTQFESNWGSFGNAGVVVY